ncbi:MAG: hypothetical protein ACP5UA_06895 [Candidatus Hydrogenedens sp.]
MIFDFSKCQSSKENIQNAIGLWILNIQGKDVCFWGNFEEASKTAELYLKTKNIENTTVYLIDCVDYSQMFHEDHSINSYSQSI